MYCDDIYEALETQIIYKDPESYKEHKNMKIDSLTVIIKIANIVECSEVQVLL